MFTVSFLIKALALMMMMIILIKYYAYFVDLIPKANTAHNSNMFGVVSSSFQKFTIILIMKPIILFSIMNKYLDLSR